MNEIVPPLVDVSHAVLQPMLMANFHEKSIQADILRLDMIHPVISGNKWFKLKHYLYEAIENRHHTVLTFGGAWSNHIVATAYAVQQSGMQSIGIIRGERPARLSTTLQAAAYYGMRLEFISRKWYAAKQQQYFLDELVKKYRKIYVIPEGGAGYKGIEGSEEILVPAMHAQYSHIICCMGTGTMYTGLATASANDQLVIGIPVLKGVANELNTLIKRQVQVDKQKFCKIVDGYHFGGYAKKTPALLHFMNDFYTKTGIPSDFVYTGKLFYAFNDMVENNFFEKGSKVLVIHSGGLQGNSSLPVQTLIF